MRNLPCTVSISRSAMRRTIDSFALRYSIRSAIVPMRRPCCAANSSRSGSRAIVPSSFMISHSTAAGVRPARRARSQQASVCPARISTPPASAISGNTWPGWTISEAFAPGAEATLIVSARSCAEIPVAMPSAASIDAVKLVPWRERFSVTIGRKPRREACSAAIGMQIRPRPWRARKLTFSAVTKSAANTRSPSFSRSSSSTRMTMLPARMSPMISAIGLIAVLSRRMAGIICPASPPDRGEGRRALRAAAAIGFAAAGALADARGLARALAQVIQLGAAHVALSLHFDRRDQRRIRLERALDAFARRDLAHDERGAQPAVALGNDDAFERLLALLVAFDHADAHD